VPQGILLVETVEPEAGGDWIGAPVEIISTTVKVLLHHGWAQLRATQLGVWAGIKAPKLGGTPRRLYIPSSCLPAIRPV